MKYPQCQHKTEKESDKGNGRCSRCAMPTQPLNHVRFWSSFWHNVTSVAITANGRNADVVGAIVDVVIPISFPGLSSGQYAL